MMCKPAVALQIAQNDNVASAVRDLEAGERVVIGEAAITVTAPIPRGHKFALSGIKAGDAVLKFGWPIGVATADIGQGDHVHSQNLATALTAKDDVHLLSTAPALPEPEVERYFDGYLREDGRVGTRNELWILCTVGCVSNIARRIADTARPLLPAGVDGIYAFPHPFGCSQLGGDLAQTRTLLASLACNPNAGGVLIVGLGCENNQLDALLAEIPENRRARVRTLVAQSVVDEMDAGRAVIEELAELVARDVRTAVPLGKLVIGLKCGGSDGLSGLTANPLVGDIASRLYVAGGTPILTEIPEIFGAEHMLLAQAATPSLSSEAAALIDGFKQYFVRHGQPVHENPSPGNKAGGITTLEEKSLGAVQKAGAARLTQVLHYGERVRCSGLALLEAPGNDAVSSTALAAAGATMILFTTGRGTPMGFPVPVIKIASNSDLAERKPHWIDFDAGRLLTGTTRSDLESDLLATVMAVASGEQTRAELNGEREIAIWKQGVTV
jgi:altronate hydrolase